MGSERQLREEAVAARGTDTAHGETGVRERQPVLFYAAMCPGVAEGSRSAQKEVGSRNSHSA